MTTFPKSEHLRRLREQAHAQVAQLVRVEAHGAQMLTLLAWW